MLLNNDTDLQKKASNRSPQHCREKRTVFANSIRQIQREKIFEHLRYMRDEGENVQHLIKGLPETVNKIAALFTLQQKHKYSNALLVRNWFEIHGNKFKQIKIQNLAELKSWVMLIDAVFRHFPVETLQILGFTFIKLCNEASENRNFECIFSLLTSIVTSESEYCPKEELQIVLNRKWNSNVWDKPSKYFTKNELLLYFYLLKRFPVRAMSEIINYELLCKMVLHLGNNYYSPEDRGILMNILIVITYEDKNNYFTKHMIEKTKLINHLHFFIGFYKDQKVRIRACLLAFNIIVDNGLQTVLQSNLLTQLVECLDEKCSRELALEIRHVILIAVLHLETEQQREWFNKEIEGLQRLVQIADEEYCLEDKSLKEAVLNAIGYLFRMGEVKYAQNPYKLAFQTFEGINILKKYPQGVQFLQNNGLL